MAIINGIDLSKYSAAGVYTIYSDSTIQAALATNPNVKLIVGFSKQGLFNTGVFIAQGDIKTAEAIFGPQDKSLERAGSFFHRALRNGLQSGPVVALNLLDLDNSVVDGVPTASADQVPYRSYSVDVVEQNGVITERLFASYYNKERFWRADPKYLLGTRSQIDKGKILNIVNISQSPASIIIKKSAINGFDVTAKEWFAGQEMPAFVKEFDLISDYFIDVYVISGNFGPDKYAQLALDPVFGKYFDTNGLIASQIDAFLSIPEVIVKRFYTGSLIPNFKDKKNVDYYIQNLINNETNTTGILCAIDRAELDKFVVGTNTHGLDLVGHSLIKNPVPQANFLSYNKRILQDFSFTKKTSNSSLNVNATTGITINNSTPGQITVSINNTNPDFLIYSTELAKGDLFKGKTTLTGIARGISVSEPSLKVTNLLVTTSLVTFTLSSPLKEAENGISGSFVDLKFIANTAVATLQANYTYIKNQANRSLGVGNNSTVTAYTGSLPAVAGGIRPNSLSIDFLAKLNVVNESLGVGNGSSIVAYVGNLANANIVPSTINIDFTRSLNIVGEIVAAGNDSTSVAYTGTLAHTILTPSSISIKFLGKFAIAAESLGIGNNSLVTPYTGALAHGSVVPGSITIDLGTSHSLIDNGSGLLTGDGSGSINYVTGVYTFTTNPVVAAATTIHVAYTYKAQQTITDDGSGLLTGDGSGSINYGTGVYSFTTTAKVASTDMVRIDYVYINTQTITDNGTGGLVGNGGGTINYVTGAYSFTTTAAAPSTSTLRIDYTHKAQQIITDNGAGGLIGAGAGTINYTSGAYSFTTTNPVAATDTVAADYDTNVVITNEAVGSNYASLPVVGAFAHGNIVPNTVQITYSVGPIVADNGSGLLTGQGSGSINYITGAFNVLSNIVGINSITYETTNDRIYLDGSDTFLLGDASSDLYKSWKNGNLSNGDRVSNNSQDFYVVLEAIKSTAPLDVLDDYRDLIKVSFFVDQDTTIPIAVGSAPQFGETIDSLGYPVSDANLFNIISVEGSVNLRIPATQVGDKQVRIPVANAASIKVGQYLVGFDSDNNEILTQVVTIKNVGSPVVTDVEVTCRNLVKIFTTPSSGTQVERFLPIEQYFDHFDLTYLHGFKLKDTHMPDGTNERIREIYQVIYNTNIFRALTDPEFLAYRYFIDTFNGGLEVDSKNYLANLVLTRQKSLALLNTPSFDEFAASSNPRFTETPTPVDPVPVLNTAFILSGGNLAENPEFLYTLPSDNNQATYAGFFSPNIVVQDSDSEEVSVPPTIYVQNNFVGKFTGANPYLPTAGGRRGVISSNLDQILRLEYPLDRTDRGNLEQKGINPIIVDNGVMQIYGDSTAFVKYSSALNRLSARDALITFEIDTEVILKQYIWEFNDDSIRTEVKTLLTNYYTPIRDNFKAIKSFELIFDRTNNPDILTRNNIGFVDVRLELADILRVFIQRITLFRNASPSSGGFVSV